MKCMIVVLNHIELLDDLLVKLEAAGVRGATILDSTGMAKRLYNSKQQNTETDRFFGSLRYLIDPDREESKTVFCVLKDENTKKAISIAETVLNNFTEPDTGFIFTVPVDFVEGGSFSH